MKQYKHIAYLGILLLATLTACDSHDMTIQHAESYDYITFSAETQKLITRANPYEAYNPSQHPTTMGAFGFHDIANYDGLTAATQATSTPLANPIFDNEVVTYSTTSGNWNTATLKRWDDYRGAKTFDFFAYMPHVDNATLTRIANDNYALSIPYTIPAGILLHTQQAPIICALPEHKEGTTAGGDEFTFAREIDMQFDQTLTGYQLLLKLDKKMGAIRNFRIKNISLTGDIATSGNISRTFQWTGNEWTAGNISWENIQRTSFSGTNINIPNKASDSQADDSQTLLVTSDDFAQWGPAFYVIPDAQFLPTINVTYDVEFVAEDGSTIITRKDVTSAITLNKNNFSNLSAGGYALIHSIRILIQPRYLYVLSDEDAYTGHLLID